MPLPLFLLDLPPAVEHQSIAHQSVTLAALPSSSPTTAEPGLLQPASPLAQAQPTQPLNEPRPPVSDPPSASPSLLTESAWQDGAVPAALSRETVNRPTQPERVQSVDQSEPTATEAVEASDAEIVADQPTAPPTDVLPDVLTTDVPPTDVPPTDVPPTDVPTPEETVEVDPTPGAGAAALRLRADQQTYETAREIITATGDVLVQFGNAQLASDRLWVNLNHRYLRAEGNVFLNRNQQIIEGDTATYNLLQGNGTVTNGRGSLRIATIEDDFSPTFPNDLATSSVPIDYRLESQGSISQVTSPGGLSFSSSPGQFIFGGEPSEIGQLRFETSYLAFDADGWEGEDVRLTNDPFSPPELELRGDRLRLTPLNEEEDELCVDNPRAVFDQWLSLPLVRRCYLLQRGRLPADTFNPLPTTIGYDNRDRDGFFIAREFPVIRDGDWRFTLAPQFYISRWLDGEGSSDFFDPANFGLVARAQGPINSRTLFRGVVSLSGLDLDNLRNRVRANLRVQQRIGTHRLSLEYTYRDRLFNGTLGFQDVQTSAGVLLESPVIPLGNSKINLTYQLSGQYVNANTDRPDLLDPGVGVGLAGLLRFQGAVDLSRGFLLWQGQAKPSTPTEGLRYSPRPVVPALVLITGLRGITTYYSSNDSQQSLEGRVILAGQLGHLVRNYFDYTQFNIGLTSSLTGGTGSPFFFDRLVDQNVLSGGITQQIYGPLLVGFQTSYNLDTSQEVDTFFSVEYRRRAYGLFAQYSPTQETGFFGFRLSSFNWTGRSDRFDDLGTNEGIVIQ